VSPRGSGTSASHCIGKGRKERNTPLLPSTAALVRVWLTELNTFGTQPLFPTSTGRALSRDAVEHRITRYAAVAAQRCPSLKAKKVTAHTLRHTAAMRLKMGGVASDATFDGLCDHRTTCELGFRPDAAAV
jgi:integrase